jgi:glycerophosphoryl diester phosphodiesterase
MISIYGLNLIKIVILKKKDLLINFLTCFLVLQIFIWMYLNHPFQYVYFNLLAEKNFNKNFEMDYWGISNKIALEYIAKKTNKKVYVYNLNTSDLALSNKILKKKNRDLISVTYDLSEANYIINSFRDWNGATKPQDYLIPSNFEILYEIKVDGVTINSIYKKNKIF